MKTNYSLFLAASLTAFCLCEPLLSAPPTPAPGARIVKTPFRLLFLAYDGDPKTPEKLTFQIATLDLKQPSTFLKLGDTIPNTKLKLTGFKHRIISGANIEEYDASELTVVNTETDERAILTYSCAYDIPTVRYVTPKSGK